MMHCVNHKEVIDMNTDGKTTYGEAATTMAEVAIGAAQTAAQVASDPIGTARKQVKGFERKGTPTARRVNRKVTARFEAATAPARDAAKTLNARFNRSAKRAERFAKRAEEVAGGLLPEKLALRGLHLVKVQAKRQDIVGDVAKGALNIFNESFKTIAKTATRLEKASELSKPAVKPTTPRRSTARR